jgi:hypothetical protein
MNHPAYRQKHFAYTGRMQGRTVDNFVGKIQVVAVRACVTILYRLFRTTDFDPLYLLKSASYPVSSKGSACFPGCSATSTDGWEENVDKPDCQSEISYPAPKLDRVQGPGSDETLRIQPFKDTADQAF